VASQQTIETAATILRQGGLVAFPTETVYGLGADAANETALRRLFAAKGRPADHPVIVHIRGLEDLSRWAAIVPPPAVRLAERFWPGPLTMILPRAAHVPDLVTGGQPTVGLRVPGHPLALALLAFFGGGIAAPSANRFGRISPTCAEHVRAELGGAVDFILDGGPCRVGVESTIVDLSGARPAILRPGAITAAEVSEAIGEKVSVSARGEKRAPGTLEAHYAPRTPLFLVEADRLEAEAARALASGRKVAALARRDPPPALAGCAGVLWHAAPAAPEGYARALYAALRDLDERGAAAILVEAPPEGEAWVAVRDRLSRAARGSQGVGP
jgi:L-threonylcarbamoyladenylate synthase